MPITNNNIPMVDLPFFEILNQAPAAASATAAMTTSEEGNDRFIYYMASGTAFFRYDTITDTWQRLANPPVAPATTTSMRYTKYRGYHGRILSANSTHVTIPFTRGVILSNTELSITRGTGIGQKRTITHVSDFVHEAGVITAVGSTAISDNLKKWRVNQWAGYSVIFTYGTGSTIRRKILYNDTTSLYYADANLQPHDPWSNQPIITAAPYTLPVTSAGSQAHYQIMSSTFSCNTAWSTPPDYTSHFMLNTGGIYLLSTSSAAPFFAFQYYDVIDDQWQTKTVNQGLISAALATDVTMERTGKIGTNYVVNTGTVSATSRTISDDGLSLTTDRYANYRVEITSGTGVGQSRRIVAHNANSFTIARNWDVTPDNTSGYEVYPDFDRIYMAGNGGSTLFAYSPDNDYWMQGQGFDDGVVTNIACVMKDWNPIGVSTGVRIAAGITSINSTPTFGGTNYTIGDVLTHTSGGTGAQIRVKNIAPGGVVTELELVHTGTATGFTTGTGKTVTGGTGSGCTFEIVSVGPTALITTASNHFFKAGDEITFLGCNDSAWNTAHTIIGVPAINTFCVAVTATANMVAAATQSTTTIIDPTKNWIPNEHVGRLVHLSVAGTAPAAQVRWITGNSNNTLTVATITAGVNGTSKYSIYDAKIFGVDDQRKETGMEAYGWATGGSNTTLEDSTKNWIPNQWAGYNFKIEAGTGFASGRITITQNTSNTLTFATQSFSPDITSKYEIADSWGLCTTSTTSALTDSTKVWATNQWAGKRSKITAGTGVSTETTITASTANTVTSATTDATSAYAILAIPPRSTGLEMIWNWGATDTEVKGKYLYLPRGGGLSGQLDIYDISLGKWRRFGEYINPVSELLTTGTSYCYNGDDIIYIGMAGSSVVMRILAYNIKTQQVVGAFTTNILQGSAHIGNFLEIVKDPSGTLSYIYNIQNSGTILQRALIY